MPATGRIVATLSGAALLAGCVMVAQTPDGGLGVTAGSFNYHFTGPVTCTGALAEFKSVIDGDVMTGNLNKGVYERAAADLNGPRAACAAGRDGEALRQLAGIKSRYGYR